MRPTPEQAMVRVKDYIALLEAKGVPTALFRERVRDIQEWGRSVRVRKPDPLAPKSDAMKKVQHTLDGAVASEKSVREQRRNHPFYPYESEEQRTASANLERNRHVAGGEGEHLQGPARRRRQAVAAACGLAGQQAPVCKRHRPLCSEIAKVRAVSCSSTKEK